MSHDKKQTKINLNAEKARWLLEGVERFVADRPLNRAHIAKLVSEMEEGHFLPEITTIMVAELKGMTYRINGQHTATAVLKCAEKDPSFMLPGVTLMTFTVTSDAELRQLYARVDRGASRTNTQVTQSILVGTSDYALISLRVLKLLPAGLAFMRFEDSNQRLLYAGETAALDVQGDYLALSKLVGTFLDSLNYREVHHGHMFRAPVVAALYATFALDAEDSERFWRAVATGVGFESESEPAARLRQTLQNTAIGGGHQYRSSKKNLGAEEMYRGCLHAWNRFREGTKFQQALQPTVLKSRAKLK